jgi:RNA polymerase sigma-70 factor, ECF subfamily
VSPPGADDPERIARARAGDRAAFGELVRRHQDRVYRTAFHMTGNHSDADDVVQEALLRAYRGLARFDGRASFGTWLYRIVVNAALNHLRSRRRLPGSLDAPEEARLAGGSDPRQPLDAHEVVTAVLEALAALSPALRVTLIMATLEEMSYRDIAQALEIPEGTVAWRVNQARKLLRWRLGAHAPELTKGNVDEVLRRTKDALGAP